MIGKNVANRLWQNAALCALLAGCVSGCTKIDTFGDIQSTLQAASSNTAVLLCPFFVVNDSNSSSTGSTAVSLKEIGVKLICAKTNADDKCVIKGTSRHLEIMGDGITVLGFDFIGSKNAAVAVLQGAGTSFIDCNFLDNDRTDSYSERGGAIDIVQNTSNVLIIHSDFARNEASSGGAVFGGDVTVISSTFNNNTAKGGSGGAMNIDFGVIRNSTFSLNFASLDGPVVYASDSVCRNGMNDACHGFAHRGNTCDGVFTKNETCDSFDTVCEYPSAMPTSTPTSMPSSVPSSLPTRSPSSAPSKRPSNKPSSTPTKQPSVSPSAHPSKSPSVDPSRQPTVEPSTLPTGTPSASPTSQPTGSPSSHPSMLPTVSPTSIPTRVPSTLPSNMPSRNPSFAPTSKPSLNPTSSPTSNPSTAPTREASSAPSKMPTGRPSSTPTNRPTLNPTDTHSSGPSSTPTSRPTSDPTNAPSRYPTSSPSSEPTSIPTKSMNPTSSPSNQPSISQLPTNAPSYTPSVSSVPSNNPTSVPSSTPSMSMMPTDKCQMNRDERARVIKGKIASRTETIKESVLQWLIESDPYYICPQNDNVAQRYAAAIVHQDALQNNTVYLKDECDWPGFICDSKNNIVAIDFDMLGMRKLVAEVALFDHMVSLVIKDSKIVGDIPPAIFELQGLKQIDLDKNNMTGVVKAVDNKSLQRLDLNFNRLSGGIEFLHGFPNLQEAHLDNNMFEGTIPSDLGQLKSLSILTLHGNSLTGTMPHSVCNLRTNHTLKYLMADCEGPNPKVVCDCCTHCSPY